MARQEITPARIESSQSRIRRFKLSPYVDDTAALGEAGINKRGLIGIAADINRAVGVSATAIHERLGVGLARHIHRAVFQRLAIGLKIGLGRPSANVNGTLNLGRPFFGNFFVVRVVMTTRGNFTWLGLKFARISRPQLLH